MRTQLKGMLLTLPAIERYAVHKPFIINDNGIAVFGPAILYHD